MAQAVAIPSLEADYADHFGESLRMHQRAKASLAGGIAHDGRFLKPFPLYVERAEGAYKWDVDQHRLVDYAMGHGALILGHNNPRVTSAVHAALDRGTHFGAGHKAEILWAEQVRTLVPSADLVRFTSSGTEANLLAMRIARAFTGRSTILKFDGHFHGWSDYLIKGEKPPFEKPTVPGVPDEVLRTVAVLPPDDLGAIEERLVQGDIAAIIVEPSGASWASIPLAEGFLQTLRDLSVKYQTLLIFDEVITGFRWGPGGAQQRFEILPDITTMAKILAGGFPGGGVAGRADVMEHLLFKDDTAWNTNKKVIHPGTYNGNPVAATAGYACLQLCADPAVQRHCDEMAARLRGGINSILEDRDIPGAAWGESSVFHIILGEEVTNRRGADLRAPDGVDPAILKSSGKAGLGTSLTIAMALEGIDLFNGGGLLSVSHTAEDIDFTVEAFSRSLTRLQGVGLLHH
jgi:glutamate-1-semialdehyde 2,1-aminomutase